MDDYEETRKKFEQLFEYLTEGRLPDGVTITVSPPCLSPEQAQTILWLIEEGLKIDNHDLRMEVCSYCGNLYSETLDGGTGCEKCNKTYCTECACRFEEECVCGGKLD